MGTCRGGRRVQRAVRRSGLRQLQRSQLRGGHPQPGDQHIGGAVVVGSLMVHLPMGAASIVGTLGQRSPHLAGMMSRLARRNGLHRLRSVKPPARSPGRTQICDGISGSKRCIAIPSPGPCPYPSSPSRQGYAVRPSESSPCRRGPGRSYRHPPTSMSSGSVTKRLGLAPTKAVIDVAVLIFGLGASRNIIGHDCSTRSRRVIGSLRRRPGSLLLPGSRNIREYVPGNLVCRRHHIVAEGVVVAHLTSKGIE